MFLLLLHDMYILTLRNDITLPCQVYETITNMLKLYKKKQTSLHALKKTAKSHIKFLTRET